MKKLMVLMLVIMISGIGTGCAANLAMKMPGPTQDESVSIGQRRSQVEGFLGVAPTSQYEDHGRTVARYEYSDGPTGASKIRVLVYVAADLFTIFLSELIFWPIESYATERVERVGTAHYEDNMLVAWTISRGSGETLSTSGASSPPPAKSSD